MSFNIDITAHVHLYTHDPAQLDRIEKCVSQLTTQGTKAMATFAEIREELAALKTAAVKEKAETQAALAAEKEAHSKADTESEKNKAIAETATAKVAELTAQLAAGTPVSQADLDDFMLAMRDVGLAIDDITPANTPPVDTPPVDKPPEFPPV